MEEDDIIVEEEGEMGSTTACTVGGRNTRSPSIARFVQTI